MNRVLKLIICCFIVRKNTDRQLVRKKKVLGEIMKQRSGCYSLSDLKTQF